MVLPWAGCWMLVNLIWFNFFSRNARLSLESRKKSKIIYESLLWAENEIKLNYVNLKPLDIKLKINENIEKNDGIVDYVEVIILCAFFPKRNYKSWIIDIWCIGFKVFGCFWVQPRCHCCDSCFFWWWIWCEKCKAYR